LAGTKVKKVKTKKVKIRDIYEITLGNALRRGSWRVRATMLVSGLGNLLHGQIIKGLLFLFCQAATWLAFIFFGIEYVRDFGTLGTVLMDRVYNEALEIYVNIPGDNSLQILLYSVFAFSILLLGQVIHLASVKSAYKTELDIKKGRRPSTISQDFNNMFDSNMHTTMLTLPSFGVIAFTVVPIIFMILLAFTNFDRNHQPPGNLFTWVGMENFRNMLNLNGFMGHTFIRVLGWTIVWAIFATFLNYFFGMILALIINKNGIRFKSFWRTCFVIAIAVPGFVTLLFMRQALEETGTINEILKIVFKMAPIRFLSNTTSARISVIVVNLWIGIPYTMIITSGILMNIPADLYEAANIDGAGVVRKFQAVTLPYMLIVTAPYLITQFIGNINNFNAIFFLTGGGPLVTDYYNAGKTDLLVTWLYRLTVTSGDYSVASVIGILTFLVSATIALVTFNITASAKKEETFK